MLGLTSVIVAEANSYAVGASNGYNGSRQQLDSDLEQAGRLGYTRADLASIYVRQAEITSAAGEEPLWIGDRAGFYRGQAGAVDELRGQLRAREATLMEAARAGAAAAVTDAGSRIEHDNAVGVAPADLDPLRATLSGLRQTEAGSNRITGLREVSVQAQTLSDQAVKLGAAQEVENAILLSAANQIKADKQGSLDAIRLAGQQALAAGRNDATVATYLQAENKFGQPITSVSIPYQNLEKYATKLSAVDLDQASLGAAAAVRYAGQVHDSLMKGMPAKAIVVNYTAQELSGYEGARNVVDTLVTTGRPQLPTDIGSMSVLWKSSPWTMHSPWPKESQWWYPDTKVKQVVWFTVTGEGLHDADWEFPSQYGPGGQFGGGASHGCVHVPEVSENFLFSWADVGTPVIVYPGDGTRLSAQLAQVTVDPTGTPTTGPKGA